MSFDVLEWMGALSKNTKGQPQFADKLGERVQRVIETMRHLAADGAKGVSGEVTVKFSFDMEGNIVVVTPKISSKEPAEALNASTSYIGPDGALWDQDPRQFEFAFKGGGMSSRTETKGAANGKGDTAGTGGGGDIKAPER